MPRSSGVSSAIDHTGDLPRLFLAQAGEHRQRKALARLRLAYREVALPVAEGGERGLEVHRHRLVQASLDALAVERLAGRVPAGAPSHVQVPDVLPPRGGRGPL